MSFRLHIPTSLEQALEIRRSTGGTYLAAGTVALVNHKHSEDLISIERIPGLNEIEDGPSFISIGALVTFDDLERIACVKDSLFALWQAAHEIAGPQIRHRATIGGNIGCMSPASDSVTALVALDAQVEIFDGSYRTVPIEKLTELKDDDIIVSVKVPKSFSFSAFEKVGKRNAMSVSVLNMAIARRGAEYRVCVGCAAPRVLFCRGTSDVLSTNAQEIEKAKDVLVSEIHPIDDRWGTVQYRREVARNLLGKLVMEAAR